MSVELRAMTEAEYQAWRQPSIDDYAQSWVDNGVLTAEKARTRAEKEFRELLPDGPSTPDHALWTAYDGDSPVGSLWVKFGLELDPGAVYIYDISVRPDQRRRGYGQAILHELAALASERGMTSIRLNVFGHNTAAIALYQQLGFITTNMNMQLPLDG